MVEMVAWLVAHASQSRSYIRGGKKHGKWMQVRTHTPFSTFELFPIDNDTHVNSCFNHLFSVRLSENTTPILMALTYSYTHSLCIVMIWSISVKIRKIEKYWRGCEANQSRRTYLSTTPTQPENHSLRQIPLAISGKNIPSSCHAAHESQGSCQELTVASLVVTRISRPSRGLASDAEIHHTPH